MKMGSDEIHVNNVLFSVRGKGELAVAVYLRSHTAL